jgi:hypothetical protein
MTRDNLALMSAKNLYRGAPHDHERPDNLQPTENWILIGCNVKICTPLFGNDVTNIPSPQEFLYIPLRPDTSKLYWDVVTDHGVGCYVAEFSAVMTVFGGFAKHFIKSHLNLEIVFTRCGKIVS